MKTKQRVVTSVVKVYNCPTGEEKFFYDRQSAKIWIKEERKAEGFYATDFEVTTVKVYKACGVEGQY